MKIVPASILRAISQLNIILRQASYIPKKKTHYQILGIASGSSQDQIKRAFVDRTNELHPDRNNQPADSRIGWSRENSTEKFMQVKEAYDCLRNTKKRRAYDQEILVTTGGGFLMEVKAPRFKNETLDLNKRRNESYTGPGKLSEASVGHFRDPEQEYYDEKKKNRTLYLIGALFLSIVAVNITYVWNLRRNGRKKVVLN